jgi:hypothetical protein
MSDRKLRANCCNYQTTDRAGLRTVRTLHCQPSELGEQLLKAYWANKYDPLRSEDQFPIDLDLIGDQLKTSKLIGSIVTSCSAKLNIAYITIAKTALARSPGHLPNIQDDSLSFLDNHFSFLSLWLQSDTTRHS